jgi:hypothetical protein
MHSAINPLYRVEYVKHFLSGPLAGLDVKCSLTCPADMVAGYTVVLKGNSPEYPSRDAITGNTYWVKTVDCNRVEVA